MLDGDVGRDELNRRNSDFQLRLRLFLEQGVELFDDGCSSDCLVAGNAIEIYGIGRPVCGHGLGVVLIERLHVRRSGRANGGLVGGLVTHLLAT